MGCGCGGKSFTQSNNSNVTITSQATQQGQSPQAQVVRAQAPPTGAPVFAPVVRKQV